MKSYSLRGYKIAAGKRKAKLNSMGFQRTIWVPQRILDDIFEAIKDNAVTDARVEFRLEKYEQMKTPCSYCGYIYGNAKAARNCAKSRTKSHRELRDAIKGSYTLKQLQEHLRWVSDPLELHEEELRHCYFADCWQV